MPNSSSSKYVKRRRHRHTKSRRHAKKYTIKKVMRGCSSKQYGGAPLGSSNVSAAPHGSVEVPVAQGTTPAQAATQQASAANLLNLQKLASAGNPVATTSPTPINIGTPSTATGQGGGYKSKHRRHRYKKSIGRRGRSRRFRGSRK
jgi:hypothetical protein